MKFRINCALRNLGFDLPVFVQLPGSLVDVRLKKLWSIFIFLNIHIILHGKFDLKVVFWSPRQLVDNY